MNALIEPGSNIVWQIDNMDDFDANNNELKYSNEIRSNPDLSHLFNTTVQVQNYVIHLTNETKNESVEYSIIGKLHQNNDWNPNAVFLIIVEENTNKEKLKHVKEIAEVLQKNEVTNSVILYRTKEQFEAFSWYPFVNGSCSFNRHNSIEVTQLGSCEKNQHWQMNWFWFSKKSPKYFKGCVVNVRVLIWPPFVISTPYQRRRLSGLEINLIDLISEKFKLRVRYERSNDVVDWGDFDPINKTFTGNLKYLDRNYPNVADLVLGGYAQTERRYLELDCSVTYYQDSLHWCVPYGTIIPNELSVLTSMITGHAAIAICCLFASCSVLLWISSNRLKRLNKFADFSNCCLMMFGVLFGIPIGNNQPQAYRVRFFVFVMIFTSFSLLSAYQTLLISAMLQHKEHQNLSTDQDVLKSGLRVLTVPGLKTVVSGVSEKWPECHSNQIDQCLSDVAVHRNAALILPRSYTVFALNGYIKQNTHEPLVYCFPKPIVSYSLSILMRRGFPLVRRFSSMVERIVENGFIKRWEQMVLRERYKNISVDLDGFGAEAMEDNGILRMKNLIPVFILLFTGFFFAICVFIGEVIFAKTLVFEKRLMRKFKK